jgi:hypothetical protein
VNGVEHGQAQLLLAGEVGVDRALGESGRRGDLVERRGGIADLEEELARHLDQSLAGLRLALRACDTRAVDRHRALLHTVV